jgi:hypothetical protein
MRLREAHRVERDVEVLSPEFHPGMVFLCNEEAARRSRRPRSN